LDELEWWEFESAAEMAEQVAGDIGFVIESAIEAHGDARIALPAEAGLDPVFSAIARAKGVDWPKVSLLPTADRLIGLSDEGSLYRRLTASFGAKGGEILSLVDESALGDPAEAARLADARLALLRWPLDLVCLGIDAAGGTAGLLPGPGLDRALNAPRERRAVAATGPRGDLVTLTAPALTGARAIMIVLTGDAKREVLEEAIREGPLSAKPIGRLLAAIDSPVDIFWSKEG
jgi:6-phosphogluconolactonase